MTSDPFHLTPVTIAVGHQLWFFYSLFLPSLQLVRDTAWALEQGEQPTFGVGKQPTTYVARWLSG